MKIRNRKPIWKVWNFARKQALPKVGPWRAWLQKGLTLKWSQVFCIRIIGNMAWEHLKSQQGPVLHWLKEIKNKGKLPWKTLFLRKEPLNPLLKKDPHRKLIARGSAHGAQPSRYSEAMQNSYCSNWWPTFASSTWCCFYGHAQCKICGVREASSQISDGLGGQRSSPEKVVCE